MSNFPTFYEEEQVKLGEQTLLLAINFRALDAIETLSEQRMDDILPSVLTGTAKLGLLGKVLWGLLREHHPETTLDNAAGLMFDKATSVSVGLAMSELLRRAFNIEVEAKGKNPPKRRGASKAS
jgi:hypothetical protein